MPIPKLVAMRGVPASGKSTVAREMVEKRNFKRVNKDDLRAMIDNGVYSIENEGFVRLAVGLIVHAALSHGYSVVVDDCHNNPKRTDELRSLASKLGVEFEIMDFDVPVEECIRRDALRPRPVHADRIRQMAQEIAAIRAAEEDARDKAR